MNGLDLLESLGKVGYSEKTIKLDDNFTVKIRTLTGHQEADIFSQINSDENQSKNIYKLKVATLARSIISINGVDFSVEEAKIKENDDTRTLEEKQKAIYDEIENIISKKWPSFIIDELYREHSVMVSETSKKYQFSNSD